MIRGHAYIIKELWHSKRFVALFVLNLAIGLSGLIAIGAFESAIHTAMQERSKAIYGADVGSIARRPMRQDERLAFESLIPQPFAYTQVIELYSMIASAQGHSRLTRIKAVEANYPFYGEISVHDNQSSMSLQQAISDSAHLVWLAPELLVQLNLKMGDALQIGTATLTVGGVIEEDSTAALANSWAPTLYLAKAALPATELLQPGSIAWYSDLYHISHMQLPALTSLVAQSKEVLTAADIKIRTHHTASEQVNRLLDILNDFLGLVALVALLLSGIAAGFLIRTYLASKLESIAILRSLGFTPSQTVVLYILQVMGLGVMSALLALVMALIGLPMIVLLVGDWLPFDLQPRISATIVMLALGLGGMGSLCIGLPFLFALRALKPALLLGQAKGEGAAINGLRLPIWQQLSLLMPGMLGFWGLAVDQSDSIWRGTLFFVSCVLIASVLFVLYRVIWGAMARWYIPGNNGLRWALRDLNRLRAQGALVFICLGLGVVLLNVIPQLKTALLMELQPTASNALPGLFLVDIQPEQLAELTDLIESRQVSMQQTSPMIRARFAAINGQMYDKGEDESQAMTREAQAEARFRNRGVNLSYRAQLSSAETVVAGHWWPEVREQQDHNQQGQTPQDITQGLPAISLEKEYAKRLGLQLGDELTFDIQGVLITGLVTSIRRVKWSSFQPNFFIVFEPGVLDLAPRTYLATVPALTDQQKVDLQNGIVAQLPNVTVVDVALLIEKLQGLLAQMQMALQGMSMICVLAGLLVLYSIANYQARSNVTQMALLKAMGSPFRDIYGVFAWQYGLLALTAGLVGGLLSLGMTWGVSRIVFQGIWVLDLMTPLVLALVVCVMGVGVVTLAVRRSLQVPPARLLN